eukprot:TRINITY_DN36721_c0_g4_i1.p1 TRINITY_DN36721_c0_g4~~TRINITY_DN36721_c0_g4_i1.p1  ORF type:complete len:4159 (-),score=1064.84 TRINITY_DN36721_c0_g4_i1:194-12097(-)
MGRSVLMGARSLGTLAGALERLLGSTVVVDLFDMVLDAFEVASHVTPAVEEDDQRGAYGGGAKAVPGYVEALSRMLSVVKRWLTGAQWKRLKQGGTLLLRSFSNAFAKDRPTYAKAFVTLLKELGRTGTDGASSEHFEALVTEGVVLAVTDQPALRNFWELLLTECRSTKTQDLEKRTVDAIVNAALALVRHGVTNHLAFQRTEEKKCRQMAAHVARVRGATFMTLGAGTAAASVLSFSDELCQAVAEVNPDITGQTEFIIQQAAEHTNFLQQLAGFLDHVFDTNMKSHRVALLKPWAERIIFTVEDLVALCRGIASPPPGVFQLLGLALSSLRAREAVVMDVSMDGQATDALFSDGLRRRLPGFLQDIADAVEGYDSVTGSEALKALLLVQPDWVDACHWVPVFRRALVDGLANPALAEDALRELEYWHKSKVPVDWAALLPTIEVHIRTGAAAEDDAREKSGQQSAAERRARILAARKGRSEDRRAFVRRLLQFLGSLGGECHAAVAREPPTEEVQRPAAKLHAKVPIGLGLSPIEVEPALLFAHLARLLKPGVKRRVRVAAGEALHAVFRQIIGEDGPRTNDEQAKEGFSDALRAPLLPLAIRGASDDDPVLYRLFTTLMSQFISWASATGKENDSLSALRDALLEAMSAPDSPAVRSSAARYYADLVRLHEVKENGKGWDVAQQLLQHLYAAAVHVEKFTQLGALQALSWCALSWEAEARSFSAVAECLRTVETCLRTACSSSDGQPAEKAAAQLGDRLVRTLARDGAGTSLLPEALTLQLWWGASSPEETAREFCRSALLRLHRPTAPTPSEHLFTGLKKQGEEATSALARLSLVDRPTGAAVTMMEVSVVVRALEVLAAQLDSFLWLSMPDAGGRLFGLSFGLNEQMQHAHSSLLQRVLREERTLITVCRGSVGPFQMSASSSDADLFERILADYRPRDRERVATARKRVFLAIIAQAQLDSMLGDERLLDLLFSLALAPAALLLQVNASTSSNSWHEVARHAAMALACQLKPPSFADSKFSAWLGKHPEYSFRTCPGESSPNATFDAYLRRWPEYSRQDFGALAARLVAFVDGLELLQAQGLLRHKGDLWQCLFNWPSGLTTFFQEWRVAVAQYRANGRQQSLSGQAITQALVRLLLVVSPVDPLDAPGLPGIAMALPELLSSLMVLPSPPPDALSQLLFFFADNVAKVFEITRSWQPSRKRQLLIWFTQFATLAQQEGPADDEDATAAAGGADPSEAASSATVSPGLRGSVLAASQAAAPPAAEKERRRCGEAFAKLIQLLPTWREWAISDAAHGGAQDEDAPKPPPMKKVKVAFRSSRAPADRTGLHQLGELLGACAGVDVVLELVAVNSELSLFLVDVLRAVVASPHASARMRAHFLAAVPPLLLKAEARVSPRRGWHKALEGVADNYLELHRAAADLEEVVFEMVVEKFPVGGSNEYSRDTEEYANYQVLLRGLLRGLTGSLPSMRLLRPLQRTLRERNHREHIEIVSSLSAFVNYFAVTDVQSGAAVFGFLLEFFFSDFEKDKDTENIRIAVMEKVALPMFWALLANQEFCLEAWRTHWPGLFEAATPRRLGSLMGEIGQLNLKLQELACVWGAIEILLGRTVPDFFKQTVKPELPGTAPVGRLVTLAKEVFKDRPPSFQRLDPALLRRYHIRAYAALSAFICMSQSQENVYDRALLHAADEITSEHWNEWFVEPWTSRPPELDKLQPDTDFGLFQRPGYSFAFATQMSRRRWRARRDNARQGSATMLGGSLWGATMASGMLGVSQLSSTLGGVSTSQRNWLQNAARKRAVVTLTQAPSRQRKALAATIARATQGTSAGDGLDAVVPNVTVDDESVSSRVHAAMLGLRRDEEAEEGNEEPGRDPNAAKAAWKPHHVELDQNLFLDGIAEDGALALFLTLLRTVDVMIERFQVSADTPPHWAESLLQLVQTKALGNFRCRLLVLRLFIDQAASIKPMLYGRHASFFRFVADTILDDRFGATKSFHYMFRDALDALLIPHIEREEDEEGNPRDLWTGPQVPFDFVNSCGYTLERLLAKMQMLAPHNQSFWQKTHANLILLFSQHYFKQFPRGAIHPEKDRLYRQLLATSAAMRPIRHSALRQLAIFLEYGSFDPFGADIPLAPNGADAGAGLVSEGDKVRAALLSCVSQDDVGLAAYACGVVGMLAKWHPLRALQTVQDCCTKIWTLHQDNDLRTARCAAELLQNCPWALCFGAVAAATGDPAAMEVGRMAPPNGGRNDMGRKLFTRLYGKLPRAPLNVLRPLLSAMLSFCQDVVNAGAQPSAMAAASAADALAFALPGRQELTGRAKPPPRPAAEAVAALQRRWCEELLTVLRNNPEVWRRAFFSSTAPTTPDDFELQRVAAKLLLAIARPLADMDEVILLELVGAMLEANSLLKARGYRQGSRELEGAQAFAQDVLEVCVIICDRRPDVARGEVAENVLGYLVQACASADDEKLRLRAIAYWEASLSGDAKLRLVELCRRFHVSEVESTFVPVCLQLLASLARKSAEYRRKLVRKPLSDAAFKPMSMEAATWQLEVDPRGRQATTLMPSFSSVFRASLTMARSSGTRPVRRPGGATRGKDAEGSVAASLGLDALPSQLVKVRRVAAGAAIGSSLAAAAAASKRPGADSRLLRHSASSGQRFAIAAQERETKAALSDRERKKKGLDYTPVLGEYRMGEFPDVEVSARDIFDPLLVASLEDPALAEELLLALWSGIAKSGGGSQASLPSGGADENGLPGALCRLLQRSAGDELFVHFLHRLIMQNGKEYAAILPLDHLQRSVGVSLLSGVQALEELLPLGRQATGRGPELERGRQWTILSSLHVAYGQLGESACEHAAASRLEGSFASSHTLPAVRCMQDGSFEDAKREFGEVLAETGGPLPQWELQLASSGRLNALEKLMSWGELRQVLTAQQEDAEADIAALTVKNLRSAIGLQNDFLVADTPAAAGAAEFLKERLKDSKGSAVQTPRQAMLLATHASKQLEWEESQRLIVQGYDAFIAAWRRAHPLATSSRHDLLSSLPLLRAAETIWEQQSGSTLESCVGSLSQEHDHFSAWTDLMLSQVVAAKVSRNQHSEALAYCNMARYCRQNKNYKAAFSMMSRGLRKRTHVDNTFFTETIKLKLASEGAVNAHKLADLVNSLGAEVQKRRARGDHNILDVQLLRAKVHMDAWNRGVTDYRFAWQDFVDARGMLGAASMEEQSNVRAKMAKFADTVLRSSQQPEAPLSATPPTPTPAVLDRAAQLELANAIIENVMTVIKSGCTSERDSRERAFLHAHDRLPRVFELLSAFPECHPRFSELVDGMPAWPLLRWLPQALAHLPQVAALGRPLCLLAKQHPQALFWPLMVSKESDTAGSRRAIFKPLEDALRTTSAPLQLALDFKTGLDWLSPTMRLSADFKRFQGVFNATCGQVKQGKRPDVTAAREMWNDIWNKFVAVDVGRHGAVRKLLATHFEKLVKDNLVRNGLPATTPVITEQSVSHAAQKDFWGKLCVQLQGFCVQFMQGLKDGGHQALEKYSPFLRSFDSRSNASSGSQEDWLEVPGQYSGFERPDPRGHAKIIRIDPTVLVMSSKQKPKRVKILGSDEREHWFLVKAGEDLRLDARIEQLFEAMNGLLASTATAGLKIRTYTVVPLLPDLGILEWVRPTKTMKSIVEELTHKKQMNELDACRARRDWAQAFKRKPDRIAQPQERYPDIFLVSKQNVVAEFSRATSLLPPEASMRSYLMRAALGPESLWHMRQRFAASLAATSAASYILGIGDRHLDNLMLCTKTMDIVPIDFGYSFGIGCLLAVPEMVPFRLTGFLASVLQPLAGDCGYGTFHSGLTEVLSKARDNVDFLMDMCEIFLQEPLLDWATEARNRNEDIELMPRKRLAAMRRRIRGEHPAKVLRLEMQETRVQWVKKWMELGRFDDMVGGARDPDRKKLLDKPSLTTSEQAYCLIRQATDPDILGRAWEGWAPEI